MENASAQNLWDEFLAAHPEFAHVEIPKVIHFCDNEKDANICADLVERHKMCYFTFTAWTAITQGAASQNWRFCPCYGLERHSPKYY